jgi:hypothetical protein
MTKAPQRRGFRAARARQGKIGNTPPEKLCENRLSPGGREVLPVQPVAGGHVLVALAGFGGAVAKLLLDEVQRLALD